MTSYPWHEKVRQRIVHQYQNEKLAHALLFSGPTHLGKFDFACALSQLFLCSTPGMFAHCGECAACHLLAAGTHPDFRLVQPEDSRQIKIEQIRELIGWLSQTAQRGGLKIVIINPAQQMNHQSANALLKCLEEPSANTLIFLVTPRPGSLLPTIRSRCQQYAFPTPENDVSMNWLQSVHPEVADPQLVLDIAGGLPLAVVSKFDEDYLKRRQVAIKALVSILIRNASPLDCASKLLKHEMDEVFDIFLGVLADCARYKLSLDKNNIKNKDIVRQIEEVASVCSNAFLFAGIDRVGSDLRTLRGTTNPNKTLLLESLLIDFRTLQE